MVFSDFLQLKQTFRHRKVKIETRKTTCNSSENLTIWVFQFLSSSVFRKVGSEYEILNYILTAKIHSEWTFYIHR